MNSNTVILEIRGATGGDEANIWAADLTRMYSRYAQTKGWKVTPIDSETIKITGEGAYDLFQYESGVHRVQRIPATERRGRIHTSTATVAALPEIAESQIFINPADVEMQFYRASSKGGQNVQKVSSAVRLLHRPTGLVVTCQSERDQFQNRANAMSLLRAKLWELEDEKRQAQLGQARAVIGRGMRAEKIRTYNFPQNRVTDHRIGKSWGNLDQIVEGKLDTVFRKLQENLK
ncbi:PCRF domain-containing protein [Candidatus Gottesmanbacteria bacterium]|nr:PCRF domain-containing protein [Candidatus Gottesmanbacteria bacterium]